MTYKQPTKMHTVCNHCDSVISMPYAIYKRDFVQVNHQLHKYIGAEDGNTLQCKDCNNSLQRQEVVICFVAPELYATRSI